MGFDQGRIEFDHGDLVYYTGQIIHGKLVFNQEKNKTFRGLSVKLKGYCDVHWTTRHSRRVNDRTQHYNVEHTSHEVYCEQKVYLMGGSEGEVHLKPGHHEFPFQFHLPGHCPSSFEGSDGQIRYEIKAVVDRAFKFDQEKKIQLRVVNMKDLNVEPYCKEPMLFEFEDTYCCWCMRAGTCEVTVKIPQSGYCPGQTIRMDVSCANNSNVEIDIIQFKLVENRKFIATHNHDTRHEEQDIAKLRKGPIAGNTTRNWNLEMDIPNIDLYNVDACKYIDITHQFEVKISPSGCHSDTEGSHRMVLGHIPLRELNESPPLGDLVSTINQPVHQGFPASNQIQQNPYPGPNGHSPFPQHHPFQTPGQNHFPNPPFPGNPSTPGQNPPYPGATPYPPGNNPTPGQTPPYPGASPYPAGNTNSPYPPYPTGPLPTVSPYPVGPDPYVPNPGQPGFAMGHENKSPPNMSVLPPQLPVTSHVPYPLNPPGSPYKASAPEPSTPDADGCKFYIGY